MSNIEPGALRVFYIPQAPMSPYVVDMPRREGASDQAYLEGAAFVLDAIIGLSIFEFENHIKPDYSDVPGIERWESDGEDGFEWCDVDESEYEELGIS